MERFAKIVNRFYQLTIPGIRSTLEVWQGSEYPSDISVKFRSLKDLRPFPISTFNSFWSVFFKFSYISSEILFNKNNNNNNNL